MDLVKVPGNPACDFDVKRSPERFDIILMHADFREVPETPGVGLSDSRVDGGSTQAHTGEHADRADDREDPDARRFISQRYIASDQTGEERTDDDSCCCKHNVGFRICLLQLLARLPQESLSEHRAICHDLPEGWRAKGV